MSVDITTMVTTVSLEATTHSDLHKDLEIHLFGDVVSYFDLLTKGTAPVISEPVKHTRLYFQFVSTSELAELKKSLDGVNTELMLEGVEDHIRADVINASYLGQKSERLRFVESAVAPYLERVREASKTNR